MFSVVGVFEKFGDSQLKSTRPATRETKNNLKCSTSHLVSKWGLPQMQKPSDGSVALVLGYGFTSRINRHLLAVGSL